MVRVVVGMKPDPVTVTVTEPAFMTADEGLSEVIAGAGLVTVTVSLEDPDPLNIEPFMTVITSWAPETARDAGICACNCVALKYVEFTAEPFTSTCDVLMNPEPVMVTENGVAWLA